MIGIGTATLRLGNSPREGTGTSSLLDASVTSAAHVGVHTNPSIDANGQSTQALATEGALCVNAAAVHADSWRLAFVHI